MLDNKIKQDIYLDMIFSNKGLSAYFYFYFISFPISLWIWKKYFANVLKNIINYIFQIDEKYFGKSESTIKSHIYQKAKRFQAKVQSNDYQYMLQMDLIWYICNI